MQIELLTIQLCSYSRTNSLSVCWAFASEVASPLTKGIQTPNVPYFLQLFKNIFLKYNGKL